LKEFDFRQEKIVIPKRKLPKPRATIQQEAQQEAARFRSKKTKNNRLSGNGQRYYAKRLRQIKKDSPRLI